MQKQVSVDVQGAPLMDVLAQVKEKTGIKMDADSPMRDIFLVCRFRGTVQELISCLAHFFAVDRNHYPRWVRSGEAEKARYRLERDRRCAQYVADLRAQQEREYASRMQALFHSPNSQARTHFLRVIASLPLEEQRAIIGGASVTYAVTQLAGKSSPIDFMRSLGAPKDRSVWDGGLLSFYLAGPDRMQKSICMRQSGDPAQPGHVMVTASAVSFLDQEMLPPERVAQQYVESFSDPVPKAANPRYRWSFPGKGRAPLRQVLYTLALQSGANLIADDQGERTDRDQLPAYGSLSEALDQLGRVLPPRPPIPPRSGWFWRQVHHTYLVRSLNWLEAETRVIPYRWIENWREVEKRHGSLRIEDVVELAALSPGQLRQLAAIFPQADSIIEMQAPLRWYQRASPQVRERIWTPVGVPLSELGITYEKAISDLNPEERDPPYFPDLIRVPPDRLHLSFMLGKSGTEEVTAKPAVGIFLTEYRDGRPVRRPMPIPVMLMR